MLHPPPPNPDAHSSPKPGDPPIRVTIQQPALPHYRVPVFYQLAQRPGLKVTLRYSVEPGIPNAPAEGFEAVCTPTRRTTIFGRPLLWHHAQWAGASRNTTDVLIMTWNLHYASLIPAMLRAKANGVPTILWGHGYSKSEAGWRSYLRSRVSDLATALIFYNHTTAQRYLDAGHDPSRVFVALNSIDQTPIQTAKRQWTDAPDQVEQFRRDHRLGPGPVILFVSRLDPANRLDLLIHAIPQLTRDHPQLKAVVIGGGDAERERLSRLTKSLGVDSNIIFVGPVYQEAHLAPWFLSANLFCYPANIGLSLLHAFGYGLPVVTSNRIESQNPEIESLRDGHNGLLYEDGDAASLASTLRQALSDPEALRRMSRNALETVQQRFTLDNMVDGMEAAIRHCHRMKR